MANYKAYGIVVKTSSAATKACKSLLGKKDADKLSIADLVALIKWRGGAVPKDTSKNGKPALVRTWRDLAVPEEAIHGESAGAEAGDAEPPAAPQRKKQKRRAPESDDEDSEDEQSDDEEGSEEESDDDEQYTARAVIRRKGKGKSLRYLVDWERETDAADGNITQAWDPTWERPEDICDTLIDDYEAEHS